MRYRRLGRTGLEVSEVGYGAWGIGKSQWLGAQDDESLKALHHAIDEGLTFIDTALAYGQGHSEQLVGQVVREHSETVYVASKVPPRNRVWPAPDDVTASAPSPGDVGPVAVAVIDAAARIPLAGWLGVAAVLSMSAASQSLFVTFGAWLEDEFGIEAAVLSAITFGLGALELTASALSTARTDRWGKERSVIGGAAVMLVAALTFTAAEHRLVVGMILVGVFIAGFEFAIVSAIPIGGDLVPGQPGRGLGYVIAAATLGRSITTIPATRLYESSGIGACALLGAGFALCVAVAMALRLRLVGSDVPVEREYPATTIDP